MNMWAEIGDGDTAAEKCGRREEAESDQVSGRLSFKA